MLQPATPPTPNELKVTVGGRSHSEVSTGNLVQGRLSLAAPEGYKIVHVKTTTFTFVDAGTGTVTCGSSAGSSDLIGSVTSATDIDITPSQNVFVNITGKVQTNTYEVAFELTLRKQS